MSRWYTSLGITAIILLFLILNQFFNPLQIDATALKAIHVGILLISLWILEILPMPVVALLPLILFPLFNIESLQETAKSYADPIIFLFMGGFFLALAIEKWNLHQRIALNILFKSGSNGNQILLGFMLSTFLVSMWISNTATTMMMFPIALSIISVMNHTHSETQLKNFSIALMLSIAYSSNIGGLATIIGTPPNTAYVGFMNDQQHAEISFLQWMIICLPLALLILLLLYLFFSRVLFPNQIKHQPETERFIRNQLEQLGSWSNAEKRVFVVFLITATLWISKDFFNQFTGLALNDTMIALMAGIALFAIPSGIKKEHHDINHENEYDNRVNNLLEWEDTKKMAWGILLLFGGGLALAKGLENAGVMKMIGDQLARYAPPNLFLLIVMVATISIFLSEIMSNIAQVIVLAPILTSVALAMNIPPIVVGLPMTLAASCAGMLPMGTPPNAIVYSSGKIPLQKMMKAGLVMNLVSIMAISLFCYFFTSLVFR